MFAVFIIWLVGDWGVWVARYAQENITYILVWSVSFLLHKAFNRAFRVRPCLAILLNSVAMKPRLLRPCNQTLLLHGAKKAQQMMAWESWCSEHTWWEGGTSLISLETNTSLLSRVCCRWIGNDGFHRASTNTQGGTQRRFNCKIIVPCFSRFVLNSKLMLKCKL